MTPSKVERIHRELLVFEALEHLLTTDIAHLNRERQHLEAQEWDVAGAIA
ncbi:MAG: hypothetical protein HY332_22640 [Chloroflexi bacterium]|nr:hypothetical protein [Chloroflexota bacterium]